MTWTILPALAEDQLPGVLYIAGPGEHRIAKACELFLDEIEGEPPYTVIADVEPPAPVAESANGDAGVALNADVAGLVGSVGRREGDGRLEFGSKEREVGDEALDLPRSVTARDIE